MELDLRNLMGIAPSVIADLAEKKALRSSGLSRRTRNRVVREQPPESARCICGKFHGYRDTIVRHFWDTNLASPWEVIDGMSCTLDGQFI